MKDLLRVAIVCTIAFEVTKLNGASSSEWSESTGDVNRELSLKLVFGKVDVPAL